MFYTRRCRERSYIAAADSRGLAVCRRRAEMRMRLGQILNSKSTFGRNLPSAVARGWWAILGGAALLVVTLASVLGAAQWQEAKVEAQPAPPVVAVKTAQVVQGKVAASLTYSGDVRAVSQVAVLPKASGRIERLLVDVGSVVKKGDTIAELDAASMRAQVAQARANLAAATAKLASMESGSRAEQIAQAKAGLEAAEAAVAQAEARAAAVKRGATENDIRMAEADVEAARVALERVKQGPTQTQWWQALGALDAARANMKAAEARLADVKAGPKEAEIAAAEAAVEQARAALYAADDRKGYAADNNSLAALAATGVTSAGQANRAAEAAYKAYEAAVKKLELLRSYPLPADLQAAQSAYDAAKADYERAWNAVDEMKRMPKAEDIQQAEATLAKAEAYLRKLRDGATEEEVRAAEAAVAQARAAAVQAREAYNLALRPYSENDLAGMRAQVAQAQAAVDLAEIGLSEAVVSSPIDGVVSERLQSAGALASPQSPIVTVISRDVELVLGVEESQIGQIREGQEAEVTVAAYPGEAFAARVASIAPSADPRSRTFAVRVRPEDAGGKLRPGMFAQVRIVAREKEGALLVPKEAAVTRAGQSVVFVVKGEAVEQRGVKVGMASNGRVEVLSGLEAGEEVVVAGQNDLRDGDRVRKS